MKQIYINNNLARIESGCGFKIGNCPLIAEAKALDINVEYKWEWPWNRKIFIGIVIDPKEWMTKVQHMCENCPRGENMYIKKQMASRSK
jgi:hypothetical protein